MTKITDFKGLNKDSELYLDFYSKKKSGGDILLHHRLAEQDAYDAWHISMYLKEIIQYRQLLKNKPICFEDLPRKEKNLLIFLLLKAFPRIDSIMELGSSLWELIDGLELMNMYFKLSGTSMLIKDPREYRFCGIEISSILREISILLHPEHNLKLLEACPRAVKGYDLLYDRAVSSYTFTTAKDLAFFLNQFEFGILNLFLSKDQTFVSMAAGKSFTYFSITELVSRLERPLFHLFGYKSPAFDRSLGRQVVEGFFLFCNPGAEKIFIDFSHSIPEVDLYFREKNIQLKPAIDLL